MITMNELQKGCADLLRDLRLEAGLTVPKMADLMEIDKRTWQKYEDGLSAPSVPEFIDIFNRLGEDALKKVLNLIYPSIYKSLSQDSNTKDLRKALVHYFDYLASDLVVRELSFLVFGDHGSNFVPQLQEFTALDHLPMTLRYAIAKQIQIFWTVSEANGQLINLDHVMPDINMFADAIAKGEDAALSGRNSYTTSLN